MKQVTRVEAQKLIEEVGHHSNITVPVRCQPYTDPETGKDKTEEFKTVLNNAMVYNPFAGKQYGGSNNKKNAENAMRFIKDRFSVYSNYFSYATGDYQITD